MTVREFEFWVISHKNRIYRIALAILVDKQMAEDIVQDVLITVWQKRDELSKIKNLEAWYTTLTKNKCINLLKKNKRINKIRSIKKLDFLTPYDHLQATELKNTIESIIIQLSKTQRTILHLKQNELLEYSEIGKRLNMTVANIKIHVFRSRKFIAKELNKIYNNE